MELPKFDFLKNDFCKKFKNFTSSSSNFCRRFSELEKSKESTTECGNDTSEANSEPTKPRRADGIPADAALSSDDEEKQQRTQNLHDTRLGSKRKLTSTLEDESPPVTKAKKSSIPEASNGKDTDAAFIKKVEEKFLISGL